MKKVAILQSNYIPWKGYFDLINMVDEFVLYDDMQYTKRDWRNRNKIKTPNGLKWLTMPVNVKGKYHQKINETFVSDLSWPKKHWVTIKQFYSKAPYFRLYEGVFEDFYSGLSDDCLSSINERLILIVNEILGIKTKVRRSSEFSLEDGQTEKLLGICQQVNANVYLSGPSAKEYFNQSVADERGIKIEWMDYSSYPEYSQLYDGFEHGVTILDLIFNEGPNATKFMKSFG